MLPLPCRGDGLLHARRPIYACSDPRATLTINGQVPLEQADPAWLASIRRGGGCFVVTPDQPWEKIAQRNDLFLVRRTPASPGEPPLFFRPDDLVTVAPSPRAATAAADRRATGTRTVHDKTAGKVWAVLLVALLVLLFRLARGLLRRLRHGYDSRNTGKRRRALVLATSEIEAQRSRLRVRRLQLVIADQYGTRELGRWNREKAYFSKSRILRSLAAHGLSEQWPGIAGAVDRRIERAASPRAPGWWRHRARRPVGGDPNRFDPRMDPVDYERHCALLLRRAGWDAEVTVASGDQGTDVLARRGKRSLVLQCKLYSKPVGNSAVQQVAAARVHHRADFAAVVSNADFTRRARELAATNGVYLLHHEELRDFPPSG